MRQLGTLLLSFFVGIFLPPLAAADAVSVKGRVLRADGAPIAGASVNVAGAAVAPETTTGDDGGFALELPAGEHVLRVRAEGFRPLVVRVRVGDEPAAPHDLRLEPAVLRHEEHLVVTAARVEQPAAGSPSRSSPAARRNSSASRSCRPSPAGRPPS